MDIWGISRDTIISHLKFKRKHCFLIFYQIKMVVSVKCTVPYAHLKMVKRVTYL